MKSPVQSSGDVTITEFFSHRSVFITGGSGFIGKVLIEKLLRSTLDIGNLYILLRKKKGKTPMERLKTITDQPLFDILKNQNPSALSKIVPISGDISLIGLGLSEQDRNTIINDASVVINAAASVRFDDSLNAAVLENIRGTREVIRLSEEMKNIAVFVHVSTAYSNCDFEVIEERLHPPHVSWREMIDIAEKVDEYTLQSLTAKFIHPHPNTYTFTKSLAEHLVNDLCKGKFPTVIMRPSIVISAVAEPLPGWTDNINGPFALILASGVGVTRVFYGLSDHVMDHVSVDNFVKCLIIAAWEKALFSNGVDDIPIYNSCSEIETTMAYYFELGYKAAKKYPYEKKVWVVSKSPFIIPNGSIYFILTVLLQVLPALLIDGLILLFRGKPIALKIQRKIYIANVMLYYFISKINSFKIKNYKELPNKLVEKDKQQFELLSLNLQNYSDNLILGLKQFLLNESRDISRRTRIIDKCWRLLNWTVKCIGRALLLYFLYCKRQFVFDFLQRQFFVEKLL